MYPRQTYTARPSVAAIQSQSLQEVSHILCISLDTIDNIPENVPTGYGVYNVRLPES